MDARDQGRLRDLRALGAELYWSEKSLPSDGGRPVVHHFLMARPRAGREVLGSTGPVDFQYGDSDVLLRRMVRSVLGQALAKLLPA